MILHTLWFYLQSETSNAGQGLFKVNIECTYVFICILYPLYLSV